MVVLFPAVVLAAAVIVWRGGRSPAAPRTGWRLFAAWAAAGGALAFTFLTAFTVGLLILPAAAGLLLWVAHSAPRPTEATGFVAGVGTTLMLVAFLNRDYTPCPEHGVLSLPAGSPPGASVSCGGVDPMPWLILGGALTAFALLGYTAVRALHGVSA